MRFINTLTLVVAITLYASSAALPSIEDSKRMIKRAPSSNIVGSDGGRLLRRVEKYDVDDDEMDEERTLGDALKKMNPVTAVKKATKKAVVYGPLNKIPQFKKDAAEEFLALKKRRNWLA